MPAAPGQRLVQLPDRQTLAARLVVDELLAAGTALGGRQFGQRLVQRAAGDVDVAEELGEQTQPDDRVDQFLQYGVLVLGLGAGAADHGEETGHHLHLVGVAPVGGGLLLDAAVERLRIVQGLGGREHHLGPAGGEVLAVRGGARLDEHGVTLGRTGHVERTAHREVLALVVEDVQPVGLEVAPGLLVVPERVVVPAVPQAGDDLHELPGPVVARGVVGLGVAVEVLRLGVRHRGDDVPGSPAGAEVIDRGELPRDVERLVVRRRRGRRETDVRGVHGEGGQQRQRVELEEAAPSAQLVGVPVRGADAHPVGDEEHVELAALGGVQELAVVSEVQAAVRAGRGVPPGGDVVTGGQEEGSQTERTACHAHSRSPVSLQVRSFGSRRTLDQEPRGYTVLRALWLYRGKLLLLLLMTARHPR